MNVPIPPIFLYEDTLSHYEVMDGLQRLTAIYEFYTNKFKLQGLEEWPELNGYKYSNLPEQVKKGIDRRYLSSIILLHETAKSEEAAAYLKQMVFERINSGGEKLAPQESRNALYPGIFSELCRRLAKNNLFRKFWNIPASNNLLSQTDTGDDESSEDEELRANKFYSSMYDVELVLRFFAYRQNERKRKSSLKSMLDKFFMVANLNYDKKTIEGLEELFNDTIKLVHDCFGDGAFWLYRPRKTMDGEKWVWLERPTIVMYDCIMNVMSNRLDDANALKKNAKELRKNLPAFLKKNAEVFEGRNVNEVTVKERETLFDDFLSSHI
jgi:hypothetical protein